MSLSEQDFAMVRILNCMTMRVFYNPRHRYLKMNKKHIDLPTSNLQN